jgi:hypothetical protein
MTLTDSIIYLTGSKNPILHDALDAKKIGLLDQPKSNYKKEDGWVWAADNGCFNNETYIGDEGWFNWLKKNLAHVNSCLFASIPDVVGDHEATIIRSAPWFQPVGDLGYRPAFVLQDGATEETIPWDQCAAVFIGGTTEFKLSPDVARLVGVAKSKSKHVHMGRVNSFRRFRYASEIGVDSVDGTFVAFGPDINGPKLLRWVDDIAQQPQLF